MEMTGRSGGSSILLAVAGALSLPLTAFGDTELSTAIDDVFAGIDVATEPGCVAGVILPILLGEWFDQIRQSGGSWDSVIYVHAAFYLAAALSWLMINPNQGLAE